MARRLAGTVIIDGTDDEFWPESDEHVHRVYDVQMILDVGQPASKIQIPDTRWGGECRVEVDLTARAVGAGEVQIEGEARLFEGVTESTDELEERKVVSFTVPRGGVPAHNPIQLKNSEIFGGDHAEIGISFTNSVLEE